MKSLYAVFGTILCALTMTACAMDDPPASSGDPVDEAVAPAEIAKIITVPPEMSFARLDGTLDGTLDGNQGTSSHNGCHVTLLSCADPRLSPCIPSFYQNGACSFEQAVCAAYWLCVSTCGAGHCNLLAQFPDSGSC